MHTSKNVNKLGGFTIVELLVVIVVIGILAAITIVSYSGIRNRAVIASMQSDLSNASTQFKMFHIENGYYPATISTNCATTPTNTTNLCLKPSADNSYTTVAYQNPTPQSFTLTEVNGSNIFHITESSIPKKGMAFSSAEWIVIGTQTWSKYNLNTGTLIHISTAQTNNGGTNVVEKYCHNNNEAGCAIYGGGGLYTWNEAMQYSTTEKAQGICPTGSHIPSDEDWKILERYLGMDDLEVEKINQFRGGNQGTQFKVGGSSGLNMDYSGYFNYTNSSLYDGTNAGFWSSSMSGANAWNRYLTNSELRVYRGEVSKAFGYSVRCLAD